MKFNGGNWNVNGSNSFKTSMEVDSGFVSRPSTAGDFYYLEGLTIYGGTLSCANQYGIRMGGNQATDTTGGVPFTGIQTAGLLSVSCPVKELSWDLTPRTSRPVTR